ncbi:MAG TPA: metallophosphoesterase [Thermoanaerobaculia bacterium]|nr:metallophosphoesterase [Thermoanaerobaculia bacterium]
MRLFLVIALLVFGALNFIAIFALLRLHPRRKAIVVALAVVCNLMWLFLPILNARTDFSRLIRATLGPPWFAWLCFVLVYPLVALLSWLFKSAWPSRIFLRAAMITIPIGVWSALVPLDVERVPVDFANAPNAKIAVLADLHTGLFTRPSRLRQIFATAAALKPDVVLLAGDLIDDDPYFTTKLLDALRDFPPDIPLVAVLGNHENYGAPLEYIAKMRQSRVRLLVNEGAAVGPLWIAGISDYAATLPQLRPNLGLALKGERGFPIVLAHQPKVFDEVIARRLPLALVAHTHGGQFGFRSLHWSLAGLFLPYHMGLYRRGTSQMYVNTGTGYWLLPWRIGVVPEITLIELRSASPHSASTRNVAR